MNKIITVVLSILIIFSLSCNFINGLVPNSGANSPASQPLTASGNGPAGLTAQATSADSVKLSWQQVAGATSYRIAVSIAGGDAIPVMDLDPSSTSYEDFLAMPGSQLKYAVEALSDSGSIGQSVVDITTVERKPDPLTVDAQLDTQKTSTAAIGPEGGSITLKDAKGVDYKLDIPAGALDVQTDITLTAVKNIGGLPLDGGMLGAVKIEPEGLELNGLATLSITLPDNQPSNKFMNLGFAFSGTGTEFHLKPVYGQKSVSGLLPGDSGGGRLSSPVRQIGAGIVMETLVMYGIGVGQGTSDNASQLAQYHAPTDNNAALDQKQAASQTVPDAIQRKYQGDLEDVLTYNYGYAVFTSMLLAGNCNQLKKAVANMDSFLVRSENAITRGAQRPEMITAEQQELWNKLTDKIKDVVDHAADDCKKTPNDNTGTNKDLTRATAEAGCLDGLLARIANPPSPFYKKLQNKMISKFGDTALADRSNTLDKCLPSYKASGGMGYVFKGEICSLKKPFKLTADGDGHFDVSFSPSSALSGTMSAVGGGGGCTDNGSGAYTVNLNADGTGKVYVSIPADHLSCPGKDAVMRYVQVFTITPLDKKSASCSKP